MTCIIETLSASALITDQLGVYDFGNGNAPAIFGRETLPVDEDIPKIFPAILIGYISSSDNSTRGNLGIEQQLRVRVIGSKHASMKSIRDLTYRIAYVLKDAGILVSGILTTMDPDSYPMSAQVALIHWAE